MSFQYFDAHSHVQGSEYDTDRDELLTELAHNQIGTTAVGVDIKSSKSAVALANTYKNVFASVGLHPTDANEQFDTKIFTALANDSRTVAVGECGLDYFQVKDIATARTKQVPIFEAQIAFAAEVRKPLMIHVRPSNGTMDAYNEIIGLLKSAKREYGDALTGNIHFFAGGIKEEKEFLNIDFTVSYTAVIVFAHEYDEVVRYAPLCSILSETDSPYVAPPPNRGKRNSPFAVVDVVRTIARIRNEDEELVRHAMVENAERVFGIE